MNAAVTMLVMRMQTAPIPKALTFFTCKKGYAGAGKSCQGTTLDKHTNFSAFPIATSLRQRNRPACARLVRLALASNGVIFHK